MAKPKREIIRETHFIKVEGTVDTSSGIIIHTSKGDVAVFDELNKFNGKYIKMYLLEENQTEL